MRIADSLLPEYDHEMKTTRSLLARVPDHRASWKPHAKSMTMGELAIHVATRESTRHAARSQRRQTPN